MDVKPCSLIYRHVPFEGAGYLERALQSRGIAFQYVDLYEPGAPSFDPEDFQALIFMGGPMSVNDDLPCLSLEMEAIRRAIGGGVPVLGICLGSQLIAKALGARVGRNPHRRRSAGSTSHSHRPRQTTPYLPDWIGKQFFTGTARPSICLPEARCSRRPNSAAIKPFELAIGYMDCSFTWKSHPG